MQCFGDLITPQINNTVGGSTQQEICSEGLQERLSRQNYISAKSKKMRRNYPGRVSKDRGENIG